jgi:hypothetical protein
MEKEGRREVTRSDAAQAVDHRLRDHIGRLLQGIADTVKFHCFSSMGASGSVGDTLTCSTTSFLTLYRNDISDERTSTAPNRSVYSVVTVHMPQVRPFNSGWSFNVGAMSLAVTSNITIVLFFRCGATSSRGSCSPSRPKLDQTGSPQRHSP